MKLLVKDERHFTLDHSFIYAFCLCLTIELIVFLAHFMGRGNSFLLVLICLTPNHSTSQGTLEIPK